MRLRTASGLALASLAAAVTVLVGTPLQTGDATGTESLGHVVIVLDPDTPDIPSNSYAAAGTRLCPDNLAAAADR